MLLLLIASFNKLVSRISLTAYSGTLLGVHFQSPRRNFGAGSMRNAPWLIKRDRGCSPKNIEINIAFGLIRLGMISLPSSFFLSKGLLLEIYPV